VTIQNHRLSIFLNTAFTYEGHPGHENNQVDSMSVSAVSSSPPPYQALPTPPAKTNDEQTESASVKATEAAQTGQAKTSSAVDVYA
jgi:hypothetical protein